jgi:signal transduction histidine kinase
MSVLEEQIRLAAGSGSESPVAADPKAALQRSLRASQRFTALGEMTAGLAHDFRNVLAVIQSAINLAERRAADEAGMKSALDAAREGIKRGAALTDRLLVFA